MIIKVTAHPGAPTSVGVFFALLALGRHVLYKSIERLLFQQEQGIDVTKV